MATRRQRRLILASAALSGAVAPCPASAEAGTAAEAELLRLGYRRYHAGCNHCHGPAGIGSSFAPALVAPLPERAAFMRAARDGAVGGRSGGMPAFGADPNVAPYHDAVHAYLAARASGAPGHRGRP